MKLRKRGEYYQDRNGIYQLLEDVVVGEEEITANVFCYEGFGSSKGDTLDGHGIYPSDKLVRYINSPLYKVLTKGTI